MERTSANVGTLKAKTSKGGSTYLNGAMKLDVRAGFREESEIEALKELVNNYDDKTPIWVTVVFKQEFGKKLAEFLKKEGLEDARGYLKIQVG